MEDEDDGGEHTNALYYEHLNKRHKGFRSIPNKAKCRYVGQCRTNRRVWSFGKKKSLPIGKVCDFSYICLHTLHPRTHLQKCRLILVERMPIKSASYARYYAKNRETIVERMRNNYDADKKREYYEEHKEKVKAQMADRYRRQKAERNREMLASLLPSLPEEFREKRSAELV